MNQPTSETINEFWWEIWAQKKSWVFMQMSIKKSIPGKPEDIVSKHSLDSVEIKVCLD